MPEEQELARITIWERQKWTEHEVREIAYWLREKAHEIEAGDELWASKVRLRYFR